MALAVVGAVFLTRGRGPGSTLPVTATDYSELVAAPGRVEPVSEEIEVASEVRGKLKEVLVEEGEIVRRGQLIAVLINDDYRAEFGEAQARLEAKKAELRLVINGARSQERQHAREQVLEAEAALDNAEAEVARRQSLLDKGVIAKEEFDRAQRDYKTAKARWEAAKQRHALIEDEAREEDRSRAKADVELARAQVDEARARLEKTFVRSPIDGVVLRKHLNAGESVSEMRETPIVTLGDVTVLRVRVDIDETDVGRVAVGQRAYVTADAYGEKRFWGRVMRLGRVLGKKNVRTDEPAERLDTKILETLIELDSGQQLPVGLRVDAFVIVGSGERP
jgi:ABC exporter DevB family membrane fusion protein